MVVIGRIVFSNVALPYAMFLAIELIGEAAMICPKHCSMAGALSLRHYSGTCLVKIMQISRS